jgi:uncharacterized protein YhhL (DUF1145 family)
MSEHDHLVTKQLCTTRAVTSGTTVTVVLWLGTLLFLVTPLPLLLKTRLSLVTRAVVPLHCHIVAGDTSVIKRHRCHTAVIKDTTVTLLSLKTPLSPYCWKHVTVVA